MSHRHDDDRCYQHVQALIEHDQIDWLGDGVLCQLVTLELVDDVDRFEPAVCRLPAREARELGFALLALAEHAQRLTRGQERPR
jgi:hypothetical protein